MYESFQEGRKKGIRLSTMQKVVVGFIFLILVGALLLWLPVSNVTGEISFIDALFTATSAVCVTGLMTVVPATQFTLFGKIILLILIQIGGLGVVACTMVFFIIIGKQITVRERVMIQESYNLDTLSGLVNMIRKIFKLTIIVEVIGAMVFSVQFIPEFGLKGIGYAVFHSISAFCNAGIDLIGDNSLTNYVSNPLVNFNTMALIIIGGLGFPVWLDIIATARLWLRGKIVFRKIFQRLQLHSQMVIIVSSGLIMLGFILYALMEWNNPDTFGLLQGPQKWMALLFQSVTTRTAGFATVDQGALSEGSAFITCLFMFIGGSPAGTAGGVKTTTVFMLLLACSAVVRGSRDTEFLGKRIPEENIKAGLSIIIIAFTVFCVGIVVMSTFETHLEFVDIMYEVSSALGTVGLTRGITPELGVVGKIVDIVLMYIGRLGPITMALAFAYKKNQKTRLRELPTKRIIVG